MSVPDPGHRIDHAEERAGGLVCLAVAAIRAVQRPLRKLRVAIPAGAHGGHSSVRVQNLLMTDQGELFEAPAAAEPDAPLATRLRPRSFDQLVGPERGGEGTG